MQQVLTRYSSRWRIHPVPRTHSKEGRQVTSLPLRRAERPRIESTDRVEGAFYLSAPLPLFGYFFFWPLFSCLPFPLEFSLGS